MVVFKERRGWAPQAWRPPSTSTESLSVTLENNFIEECVGPEKLPSHFRYADSELNLLFRSRVMKGRECALLFVLQGLYELDLRILRFEQSTNDAEDV